MKKLVILTAAIGMVSCLTSFGQGYLIFANSAGTSIKDGSSGGTPVVSAGTVRVGLYYNALAGQTIPGLGTSPSPTNGLSNWSLLNAPGWQFANSSTSTNVPPILSALTRVNPPTTGTFAGGTQGIQGTSPGQNISVYIIGWSALYADPVTAAANGSPLGWSNPFNELLGADTAPGVPMNTAGMLGFVVNPVPEPTLFTLAGLGAAIMMIFRRRK